MKKNVTINLDEDVAFKAKVVAKDKRISVSCLINLLLLDEIKELERKLNRKIVQEDFTKKLR